VIFPFGEILRFDITHYVSLKMLDVAVGITSLWWVMLQTHRLKLNIQSLIGKIKSFFLFPIVLFVLVGFVSLGVNLIWLQTSEFLVSLLYLIRFVSFILLLPIVMGFDEQFKKRISVFLFIDGLLILLFGYLQYFFYNSLKNLIYLGWDEHMHRIFSTFFDPNFAGGFFVLYFLFVGGLLYSHHKKLGRKSLFLGIILLLTLLAVFLTFSRSSFLMLLAASAAFLIVINKKKVMLIILAAVILFTFAVSPKFYDENMNLFRIASSTARLANYEVALRVIADHPVIGVGFNSYRYTKGLYGLDHDWVDAPSHADAGVDNSFLFVLATTGVVGGVLFGWFWVGILKKLYRIFRKKKTSITAVAFASICGLFIHALFINSLFFASILFWVFILLGLSLSSSGKKS
jgi:O-antigen ligase